MSLEIGKMLCTAQDFRKHESLLCHKHAVTMLIQPGNVDEPLKEWHTSQKKEYMNCLLSKVYSTFHAKALLFIMVSKTRSQISSSSSFSDLKIMQCFKSGLKNLNKHMSPNAKNEILEIMALKVLRGTASDIAESGYYTSMADETSDASNIEQLVICIWVDKEMIVCEEYIGLMPVAQTNADTIVICMNDVLLQMIDVQP